MSGRIPARKRAKEQIAPLNYQFKGAIESLLAKFHSSGGFAHNLTKGLQRERALISELFEKTFPARYKFTSGEIHDLKGRSSGQMDIIIYNGLEHFVFYSDLYTILPAEAALCAIEVKSTLDKKALSDALEAAHKLKSLKPLNQSVSGPRKGGAPANDGKVRYFYCLFGFESNNEGPDWGRRTIESLTDISVKLGIPIGIIDRIYSVGQGLVIPEDNTGDHVLFPGTSDGADALFRLYLDIFNFCEREDSNRPQSDLTNYSGRPALKPVKWR